MRSFKELSKKERVIAMNYATNEAMKLVALGKAEINNTITSATEQNIEIIDLLEPLAREIAERAFYPDIQDIVIKLWEK